MTRKRDRVFGSILRDIRAEYDYLVSDEAVVETLQADGVEFLALGAAWPDGWEGG